MDTQKFVTTTTNRHGTVVRYYKRNGRKIRLRAEPGTPEYLREYAEAANGKTPANPERRSSVSTAPALDRLTREPDSLGWLVSRYYASPAFTRLATTNSSQRRAYLDAICQSIHPETKKPRALLPFAEMRRVNVISFRDSIDTGPASADGHIIALKTMFNWAIDNDLATFNPASRVDKMRDSARGYHTWTDADREAFEKRHPVGTMARLAYALIRYTAVRRSDVIRLGPQFLRSNYFRFTEKKGGNSRVVGKHAPKPKRREIEVAKELRRIIEATTGRGDMVYLLGTSGRSFTVKSFSRQFRKWCDQAGLPQCSAHGIRKGTATQLADNGASVHEIAGLCGWTGASGLQMAAVYTAKADQTRLASSAIARLS